jgi:hypothetical protein
MEIGDAGLCQEQREGCTGDGRVVADPYEQDINDRTVLIVACANCVHDIAMDI